LRLIVIAGLDQYRNRLQLVLVLFGRRFAGALLV
jgi:hypothetical protein